jgi:hypothetical protein
MVQEVEALVQQTQVLPGLANKLLIAVSSRKDAAAPPPAPPAPQRQASAQMKPVGKLLPDPPTDPRP